MITLDGERQVLGLPAGLICEWAEGWSECGRSILFMGSQEGRFREVCQINAAGGAARPPVCFDDLTRALWLAALGPGHLLYLSVAEHESDIYVADLEIR